MDVNKYILESGGWIHRSCQSLYMFLSLYLSLYLYLHLYLYLSLYSYIYLRQEEVGGCEQRYLGIQWLDTQVAGVRAINSLWQGLNPPL